MLCTTCYQVWFCFVTSRNRAKLLFTPDFVCAVTHCSGATSFNTSKRCTVFPNFSSAAMNYVRTEQSLTWRTSESSKRGSAKGSARPDDTRCVFRPPRSTFPSLSPRRARLPSSWGGRRLEASIVQKARPVCTGWQEHN